eukprot:gnl/TRDRNA2_/TRDRNA2_88283_c0_seq1.p1 gnl/TRDRNA2_/TRDRNA2_88283_c0~~gnl/TRDRNA2_/TRDRNA2_88283_c0_seq1.p1  ORF type:complete len:256 (+),score=76.84 gnl/TRDRNA2_/TRDRNA2_88283_c0_seq1:84-851(+)
MGQSTSAAVEAAATCRSQSCRSCLPSDPRVDTVKVNFDAPSWNPAHAPEKVAPGTLEKALEAERLDFEERIQRERCREEEEKEARRRQEAVQRAREETELRIREERAQREREDAQRLEQARQREEDARRKHDEEVARARFVREEAELAEQAARAEKEKARALQAKIQSFLKANGFAGVDAKKKSMLSTSYPLHKAVKENDAEMVQLLIDAGANPAQKNSSGQTPRALAEKCNKKGSHDTVLSTLSTPVNSARGGA